MQTLTVSGNLGSDPTLRSTQGGDQVLGFNVAVKQGYGDKATTNWFRCNVWGKRGATLERYLRKGMKVVVQGELSIGSYEGKPQFDIRANEVEFMSAGERETGGQQEQRGGGGGGFSGDDLDDDVPFGSPYLPRDHRSV